jgi:hypothetical protein
VKVGERGNLRQRKAKSEPAASGKTMRVGAVEAEMM